MIAEQSGELELDYDLMAAKVAEQAPAQSVEFDYDELADKLAERMPAPETVEVAPAAVEIDYDLIASKVAEQIPEQTAEVELDYDLIAAKVAEQIEIPESDGGRNRTFAAAAIPVPVGGSKIDEDELAEKLAEKLDLKVTLDDERIDTIDANVKEIKELLEIGRAHV